MINIFVSWLLGSKKKNLKYRVTYYYDANFSWVGMYYAFLFYTIDKSVMQLNNY